MAFFLFFFFVGDASEEKGPEWSLTYDSQQYDRYLYFLHFLGVSTFSFHLKRNIRNRENLATIISKPTSVIKCKCIPGLYPCKHLLIFLRNYEMCRHRRHDGEEMVIHCQRLVLSHPKISLAHWRHSLFAFIPINVINDSTRSQTPESRHLPRGGLFIPSSSRVRMEHDSVTQGKVS